MYFNHAFRKSFLPSSNSLRIAGNSSDLTAGEIGFFDAKTWVAQPAGSAVPFVLAQGSYWKSSGYSDKITPYLGGYQESVKSKTINPKYITRLIKVCSQPAVNQIKEICICKTECGKNYDLRLDVKGSPALRFLSHNIYKTFSAYTGCCTDDCTATCTGALTDPTKVAINWALQIINDPWMSQFVMPTTIKDWDGNTVASLSIPYTAATLASFVETITNYYDNDTSYDPESPSAATVQGCLELTVAYVDTKFQNCTFTPTDHYELQPLLMYPSLVDYTGDPCHSNCFEVTETQFPAQLSGSGETVLRDMILSGRYMQEAYPDSSRVESLRMREIEANPGLNTIDRNALYDQVMILHSVPRFNNPTGTFDNDQYLLVMHFPACTDTSQITNFVLAAATAAGNNDLVFEEYGSCCTTTTTTAAPTTTTTTAAPSDVRLKENILATGGKVGQFNEYTWDWNSTAKSLGLDHHNTTGVLAQEVLEVMPEAVVFDENIGYYRVRYDLINKN